jgi:hypothetical protein
MDHIGIDVHKRESQIYNPLWIFREKRGLSAAGGMDSLYAPASCSPQ